MPHFKKILAWLMEGDVSIQYQTQRDLLDWNDNELRKRIELVGWGQDFLSSRNEEGMWGDDYYQPKWISTHYTLLDLKNLQIDPNQSTIKSILNNVFLKEKGPDGGILPIGTVRKSDVCVNGMVLNFASYFGQDINDLKSVIDFLLKEEMSDGGFNCHSNRKGAIHSSLHTTLSVLEGFLEYELNDYKYRANELICAKQDAQEFILIHRFFRSDKTGEIINSNFLKFYHPSRWFYDIFRALDYYTKAKVPYDPRMEDALNILLKKRTKEGFWKLAAHHPGKRHFDMEKAGQPSRWNTLRALRILKFYKPDVFAELIS